MRKQPMFDSDYLSLPDRPPIAIGILGPNGSGKTSIELELGIGKRVPEDKLKCGRASIDQETGDFLIFYVSPDDIAHDLLRKNPAMSVEDANRRAQKEAFELREWLSEEARVDFAWESVASHSSKLEFMKRLKENGYVVSTIVVSTDDPQINVKRVASRARFGGHDVPADKVVERYRRFSDMLKDYLDASDFFIAIDNSRDSKIPGEPAGRIMLVKQMDKVTIEPECREVDWVQRYILDKN